MIQALRVDDIDWSLIIDSLALTDEDVKTIGTVIVDGFISRIEEGKTSTGEDLSENSEYWKAYKTDHGYSDRPLKYTGVINKPETYQIVFLSSTEAVISVIPTFRQVHIDLIELSDKIGKNYKDWFGINSEDIEEVRIVLEEIFEQKIREILR